MKDRIPPFSALSAFEAVSRHLNFTRAGQELGLTQAAVSFQIKSLEAMLGIQLINRNTRSVSLTDLGQTYLEKVREPLRLLEEATAAIAKAKAPPQRVRMLSTQAFASLWLVPRLGRLHAAHPELEIELVSWTGGSEAVSLETFSRYEVSACVAYIPAGQERPGLASWPLAVDYAIPVCSNELATADQPLDTPADLRHHTLLHALNWRDMWPRWFGQHAPGVRPHQDLHLQDTALTVQAAMNGVGIAMAHGPLVEREIATGRLKAPLAALALDRHYLFVCPEAVAGQNALKAIRAWMAEEFRTTRRESSNST